MKDFIKILLFSIGIIAFYTLFSNYGIPQIKPSPPPEEEVIALGTMTMEEFIALGEKIFNGKGTCTLCHNPIGGRAPLLDTVGSVASERIKDPRYKGKAKNVEEYIRESMTEPSTFVVAGFGVKGTNDTQSPMPDVRTGAIGLSDAEVDAVIAFLQKKAGVEVSVKIPTGAPPKEEKPVGAPAVARTPQEVIGKFGCGACHKIGDFVGAIGPDLTKIGAVRKGDYLRRAILEPDADIAKNCPTGPCMPGLMPKDYKDKMMVSELEMLVKFMVESK